MKTKMWHEARKQEKKIKGILVDYRKRAERRHDFYEAIKGDPNQFLRLHGVKCRIHLDLSTENNDSALIPWQGQPEVMIDRFDVRTHLDFIATVPKRPDTDEASKETEERQLNYERYRVLVQNEFLGVNEEKFLQQLQIEEQFGVNNVEEKNKKKPQGGATIGFQYDENYTQPFSQTISNIEATSSTYSRYEEFAKDSSDSDLDLNLDMKKITNVEAHGLNGIATRWGMVCNDFYSFLTKDIDDAENLKLQQEEEQEKILYCGRKGRRERRAQRERRFNIKLLDADTKPSYALDDKLIDPENKPDSSRSPSPEGTEKITYITSFGGEEDQSKKMSFSEKVKENLGELKRLNEANKRNTIKRRTRDSSSSSNDRYRYRRLPARSSNDIKPRDRKGARRRSRDRSNRSSSSSSLAVSKDCERKSESNVGHVNIISKPPVEEKSAKETGSKTETVIKKYYGRRRDTSESELSGCEDKSSNNQLLEVKPCIATIVGKNSSTNLKPCMSINARSAMNARDVLKRKMQILLNKQYKEDKKLETLKRARELQEQKERESEMRELALKLRKRQRELRHRNSTPDDSENSESSKNEDIQEETKVAKKKDRSRTKSPVSRRRTRSNSRSKKSRSSSPENRSSYRSHSPRRSKDRHYHYRRHRSRSRSRSYGRRDRNRSYDRRHDRNRYSRRSRSRR